MAKIICSKEKDFIKVMDKSKWACALSEADYMDNNYVKLHEGKADVQLRELLIAGNKRDDEGFYYVPREFANIYMIYLSNYIAKKIILHSRQIMIFRGYVRTLWSRMENCLIMIKVIT